MAGDPKTPKIRAEYDAQIMQHSWEALERSYRVLKETDALLKTSSPQPNETALDQELGQDPAQLRD